MPEFSKASQIVLALAMPASAIIAYWLYFKWNSDEDCYGKKKVATSHTIRIHVLVPSKAIATVIGKQGATIKRVQAETGARLNFNDMSSENEGKPRVLMITGSPEMAQKAELMIYQIIADMPEILIEQIQVPHNFIGRIIGKSGVAIRDIRRGSGARIDIDKNLAGPDGLKAVTLSGSRQQIDVAIDLIEEIVKNAEVEKEEKRKGTQALTQGQFVPREKGYLKATAIPVEEDDNWDPFLDAEVMGVGKVNGSMEVGVSLTDDFIQVMVSAVEHPGHFWVQMVGPKSLHLEQMQKDLTQQLAFEDIREELSVIDPQPGDLLAAKFEEDDPIFYRAEVVGVTETGKVDMYFVDYGDNTFADRDKIFKLRPEFQHFPHQAVQCRLAGVEPPGEQAGWSDENVTLFEDLVYCAQWKPLYAKAMTYVRVDSCQRGQGEGQKDDTLRPCLRLIDTSGEQDVDIAEELIRTGNAKKLSSSSSTQGNVVKAS